MKVSAVQVSAGRLAGLAVVLVLLAAALVVGLRHPSSSAATAGGPAQTQQAQAQQAQAQQTQLTAAQAAAALPACPTGLTTALPAMRLACYAGGPAVLVSQPPGRPTVVNIWATWCGPCVREVPELVSFAAAAGSRVGVVGVVHEDSSASVYAFARQFHINYPLVRDDKGDVLRHFGPGPPITLLVAADGTVSHVQLGAFPSLAALEDAVATHLGVRV